MSTENPLESIATAMAFSPADWGQHHREAWIYGIVFGYDAERMELMVKRHRWTAETVARLERLHVRFAALSAAEAA